jgi:hypothetical protein
MHCVRQAEDAVRQRVAPVVVVEEPSIQSCIEQSALYLLNLHTRIVPAHLCPNREL